MSDFKNTIDVLGDEVVATSLIDKTITEFNDDVLTTVGNRAFYNCTNLTSVNLPAVNFVDEEAFEGCSSLGNILLPSLSSLYSNAFKGCIALTSFELGKITNVKENTFYGCTNLESIDLTKVVVVGKYAFYESGITSANLQNVSSISAGAFQRCSKLTSIDFPEGTEGKNFSINCFGDCTNLTNVPWTKLRSTCESMFNNCTSLTEVDLSNIATIAKKSFYNCTGLTEVHLKNVTDVGGGAFSGCKNIKNITFTPSQVTVGSDVVPYTAENVYFTGTLQEWLNITLSGPLASSPGISNLYIGNELMTNVVVPDGITVLGPHLGCFGSIVEVVVSDSVQTIQAYSFDYCQNLTKLTIGRGVTSISTYCLWRWSGSPPPATVIMLPTTPPTIGTSTFRKTTLSKIIVPVGCGDVYKSATNWSALASIIEEATE